MSVAPCPNCGSTDLRTNTAEAVGSHGPDLLPGVSGIFRHAWFVVVVCCNCGLVRFFAPKEAIDKIAESASWERQ